MTIFEVCLFLVFSLTATSVAIPKYAKPGCKDTCGKVRIPYPFGMGANCSINEWYIVDCISSRPYLPALDNVEVLGINLADQTIIVNGSMISACQNPVLKSSEIFNFHLDRSPFLFSKLHNKFVVEGCGNAFIMKNGNALAGCSTTCHNAAVRDTNNCLGISCCETTIPYHLKSYSMNLTGLERLSGDGTCRSAFLVDKNSYDEGSFSRRSVSVSEDRFYVPISLLWTLAESDFEKAVSCDSNLLLRLEVDLDNGATMESWKCKDESMPFKGNFYLLDGYTVTEECTRCTTGNRGYCNYDSIYDVDGLVKDWNFTCVSDKSNINSNKALILIYLISIGASITMVLGFVAIIYALYKLINKRITRRRRKTVFKRINGGLLLKQQEQVDPSLVDKTTLFTSREMDKATDNFNENRILGRGGQGTVYKGMLVDGRIVAVKKSMVVDESQLEQFINEVVILSQVNHRNVVKLLGCCLETEVPLLVSEFISNGTLYDRIHNETNDFPISLNMRLQIAREVAGALAYMHSETSFPIYHRDIKTTNILLDDKYRAKVSDFGISRSVSMDQTHLTTLVKGTFGYLDPEYFQSFQFTEKSDVYSFGVVLVELLTKERPISLTRFGENRCLATHFTLAMEEGRVMSIFDAMVIREGNKEELLEVADLALRCLNLIGRNRPTMKQVAIELETLRTLHNPSMVQTNIGQVMVGEELSMVTYGESTSTTTTFMSVGDKFS